MDKKIFTKEENESRKKVFLAIFNVDFHKNSAEKIISYFLSLENISGLEGIRIFEKKDKKNFIDSNFNRLGVLEIENKKLADLIYESFDGAEVENIKFDLRFVEKDLLSDLVLVKKVKSSEISLKKIPEKGKENPVEDFQPDLNDERFKVFYTDKRYKIDKGTLMYKNNRAVEIFAKEWERRNNN